ncbi:hypothetical protein ABZ468_01875 [Streptomyces sp. NPDC005708]|uniref:hypothetical protein n=1 Tax=unclassified Streptomyces TaxID=2593676 RepID=UPI003407A017
MPHDIGSWQISDSAERPHPRPAAVALCPDYHPLTLVRAALNRITPSVTLDERFKVLPPFGTPTPPAAQPPATGRGWLRRRKDG